MYKIVIFTTILLLQSSFVVSANNGPLTEPLKCKGRATLLVRLDDGTVSSKLRQFNFEGVAAYSVFDRAMLPVLDLRDGKSIKNLVNLRLSIKKIRVLESIESINPKDGTPGIPILTLQIENMSGKVSTYPVKTGNVDWLVFKVKGKDEIIGGSFNAFREATFLEKCK